MDVSSVYTSISHLDVFEASKYFLGRRCNKSISMDTIFQFIELVLTMSTFHFNGRYYSQKQGFAMGKNGSKYRLFIHGILGIIVFCSA